MPNLASTFVDLVRATMAHGLVPIIVPELETITIGGAVAGCSLESMSFAHGGFHDTCLEYEVITAAGDVLVGTPDNEHQLVFQMIHGSFGTLGILSKLKFRLVPANWVIPSSRMMQTLSAHARQASYRALMVTVDFVDLRTRPVLLVVPWVGGLKADDVGRRTRSPVACLLALVTSWSEAVGSNDRTSWARTRR